MAEVMASPGLVPMLSAVGVLNMRSICVPTSTATEFNYFPNPYAAVCKMVEANENYVPMFGFSIERVGDTGNHVALTPTVWVKDKLSNEWIYAPDDSLKNGLVVQIARGDLYNHIVSTLKLGAPAISQLIDKGTVSRQQKHDLIAFGRMRCITNSRNEHMDIMMHVLTVHWSQFMQRGVDAVKCRLVEIRDFLDLILESDDTQHNRKRYGKLRQWISNELNKENLT